MDTGRGTVAATVQLWRERLALEPDDTVSLLTWSAPAEPLPVVDHLVFGPRFELTRAEPLRSQTTFDIFGDADIRGAHMRAEGSQAPEAVVAEQADQQASASLGDSDLAEQMSEQMTDRSSRPTDGTGEEPADRYEPEPFSEVKPERPGAGPAAWKDPQRLKQAARWRLRRARRSVRDVARRGKGALQRQQSAPARAALRVLNLRTNGIATSFALSVLRSSEAAEVFRCADVVVPVDSRSQRAAWVLAQRVEGPDVVVTYPAAQRVLAARRRMVLNSPG